MKKVTMYSGDPCPYCNAAKALLKSKNVEIEEFDIWKDSTKAKEMIDGGIISGGMIPKINNCLDVASNGVKGVVIIDGRKNHSILFELLSDKGSGTLIRQ